MDTYLKPDDVADIVGVDVRTLAAWRYLGKGPAFTRVGRGPRARVRYARRDIEAFLKKGRTVPRRRA